MGKKLVGGLVGCALSAVASVGLAVPFVESGDAGDLPASAQVLADVVTITSVAGSIVSATDVDMYRFTVTTPATLSFSVAASSTIDSQLFLFNSSGAGLWANDDLGLSLDAQITAALNAGAYYLAISSWDRDPVNASNLPLFGNAGGVLLPAINSGAVTGWTGSGAIGSYTINVSTAPIPEPETWALFGLGLLGVLAQRRRSRSRN